GALGATAEAGVDKRPAVGLMNQERAEVERDRAIRVEVLLDWLPLLGRDGRQDVRNRWREATVGERNDRDRAYLEHRCRHEYRLLSRATIGRSWPPVKWAAQTGSSGWWGWGGSSTRM